MNVPLSVILPVRDEAASLAVTIAGIRVAGLPRGYEIIVVDDGSTDGSGAIAKKAKVKVITQAGAGYGAALMAGFGAAKGQYLCFLDADATYPPETLKALWNQRKKDRVIMADRFSGRNRMPPLRKVGNRLFSALASARLNAVIPDLCSGQRLFPRGMLKDMEDLPLGLHFSPALTLRLLRRGWKMHTIKTDYEDRKGQSKLRIIKDGLLFLREILRG